MILHSYATDTQNKCTELASAVAAATSPPQIFATCSAVDSFLRKHSPDQQRWFFSITFPALISRLFGFDDSSSPSVPKRQPTNGWIDIAASENDLELTGKILSFLSPNGVLLSSIYEVDRLSLVKYVFPVERLPEWVRYMLQNERDYLGLTNLCPLFTNRVKEDLVKGYSYQLQLNVFEYYLFWFAYSPVCRGNSESSEVVKVQRTRKFRFENWSYSIPGLSSAKRGTDKKTESNLYMQLLYIYLHSFIPVVNLNVHQPYSRSILRYSTGRDNSAIERAEFVVYTFIHFWLVDNDFSPLPVSVCKSLGITFHFNSVLGESPPTAGLADVLSVFVKYLNMSLIPASEESDEIDYVGSPGWRVTGLVDVVKSSDAVPSVHSNGSRNFLIQRPLYRFILRTFLFCPVGTSIKNASQVFSLWVNHMEPWSISFEEFSDLDELSGISKKSSAKSVTRVSSDGYSSYWQGYVLANYLFYSSLVMHFIGFAHKFLHADTEVVLQMVAKVISILTSSTVLMDLLKNIDTVYHSKVAESPKSVLNTLNKFVPAIRQQLQDWEYGLCENDADGSFLHENWNKDLRLFADGEDGGHRLLQLFLLRAESELQSLSGNNVVQNLQILDSLKAQVNQLFGGPSTKPSSGVLEFRRCSQSCHEIFKPRSSGSHMGAEIKYKGDSMKRPISSDEIAWLAKFLVNLSSWMNECLGLNQVNCTEGGHNWSYVEVPSGLRSVYGPKETVKLVSFAILSWIMWLWEAGVQFMRNHHLRINLRMLASKKVVAMVMAMVLIFAAFSLLKKALAV